MKKWSSLFLVLIILWMTGCHQTKTTVADVWFGSPSEVTCSALGITEEPVLTVCTKDNPKNDETWSVMSIYENVSFYEHTVSVTVEEFYYRDPLGIDRAFGVVGLTFSFEEGTYESIKALKTAMREKFSQESCFYQDGLTDYFYDSSLLTDEEWEWLENHTLIRRKDENCYATYKPEPEHLITVRYAENAVYLDGGMALYLIKNQETALKWMEYYERLSSDIS